MSLRLLLRDSTQRSFAIAGDTYALIFRNSNANYASIDNATGSGPKCMVEFSALDTVDLTGFRELHTAPVHGTLGLINVDADVFLCIISGATRVATVRPRETVQRILSVDFCP